MHVELHDLDKWLHFIEVEDDNMGIVCKQVIHIEQMVIIPSHATRRNLTIAEQQFTSSSAVNWSDKLALSSIRNFSWHIIKSRQGDLYM